MHFCLYLCVPTSKAKTSLQARRFATKYLQNEGFDFDLRFAGKCDYFEVGGYWSGRLELLRLRNQNVRKFNAFWKLVDNARDEKTALAAFKKTYPDFQGLLPICRSDDHQYGAVDDAQIMDKVLLKQLRKGFREELKYEWEIEKPEVLFTDLGEGEWHHADLIGTQWVVVIDYHA